MSESFLPASGGDASKPAVTITLWRMATAAVSSCGPAAWGCSASACRNCCKAAAAADTGNPRAFGRARACIVLFMWGGPAQQDTWDMKPDAPAEYRGEFKPIRTNVPGLQICEHLPRLARHADKLAIIRSMTHNDVNHTTATHFLLTGRGLPRPRRPRARGLAAATAPCWRSWAAARGRCRRSCR